MFELGLIEFMIFSGGFTVLGMAIGWLLNIRVVRNDITKFLSFLEYRSETRE